MKRKMIGQRRRVIVVEREKTQEENIFGQQRGSHRKPEKINCENLSTDISMIVDSEFAISQLI